MDNALGIIISKIIDFVISKGIALPGLLVAITLHELAHGFTAYALGDPTAKNNGRLTFNPIKHIDLVGFILLMFAGFGWAKPVPINPLYFKNRKLGTILVSVAGPITNFLIAAITIMIIASHIVTNEIVATIIILTALYNIILGVFNLLPFPPLDGSKILASLLPTRYEMIFYKYEKYLNLILIVLIISNGIDTFLNPVIDFAHDLILKALYYR